MKHSLLPALLLLTVAPASAVQLTVTNPSFEIHDPFVWTTDPRGLFNSTIVGWDSSDDPFNPNVGTFQPSTPGNPFGQNVYLQDVPDGVNVAYSNEGEIFQQNLADVLLLGETYTLQVDVGNRLFAPSSPNVPNHLVELMVGNVVLASASAFPSPLAGFFSTATLVYTATAADPIGQALGIRLSNLSDSPQVNWDNVRLTAAGTGVPIPSDRPSNSVPESHGTLFLLGFGVFFVGLFARKTGARTA